MYGRKVPMELWGLAMQCAAYMKNRTVSSVNNITPFELWFKRKPGISNLKVFGCPVFIHVPDEKRKKLNPKAVEAMMDGYVEGSTSGYQIWDPRERKLAISRDITFEEQSIMELSESQTATEEKDYYSTLPIADDHKQIGTGANRMDRDEVAPLAEQPVHQEEEEVRPIDQPQEDKTTPTQGEGNYHQDEQSDEPPCGVDPDQDEQIDELFYGFDLALGGVRRSERIHQARRTPIPTDKIRQFRGYPAIMLTGGNEAVGPSTKVKVHVAFFLNPLQSFSSATQVYGKQEFTYRQALSSPDAAMWKTAIKDEYSSLIKNGTWELAPLPPPNLTAIKCK
jgi:hypothetical protein